MKSYRVGIIGLGRMGSTIDDEGHSLLPYSIAASCRASDHLDIAAGCDLHAEKREAFKDRWGVEALYEDCMEMVRQEQPDIVAVCTTASGLPKPAREAPCSCIVPSRPQTLHLPPLLVPPSLLPPSSSVSITSTGVCHSSPPCPLCPFSSPRQSTPPLSLPLSLSLSFPP